MSWNRIGCLCVLEALAAVSIGCSGGDPLDYETAMSLVKERQTDPISLTFSASPPAQGGANITDAYARLVDAHVITCTNTEAMGKICQPGPAGESALTPVGSAELSLNAGRWVPSTITSISRSGGSTASAEVRMRFELSPLYRDFEDSFDAIQIWAGKSPIENKKEGKMAHAVFQRYEDGWHLESLT